MATRGEKKKTNGRCVALYPGAFRPPHVNHFAVVNDLATRPDVDEVVVIVTNRCRHIPGTTKTLDTDIALQIWSVYLTGLNNVRVEVAPKSAVRHALAYFNKVDAGDTLLFSVGESDLREGDGRFAHVQSQAEICGVKVLVVPGPSSVRPVRATALREALARGNAGRQMFSAALPDHLTRSQKEDVWSICVRGMKEIRQVTMEKIRQQIHQNGLGRISHMSVVKPGKHDEIFRVELSGGKTLMVKYGNDAVRANRVGLPGPKPRARLKAERATIKWLRENVKTNVVIPEVAHYDKTTRTLMLTEICPGGRALEEDLAAGVFSQSVAEAAGQFLAQCHYLVDSVEPLWDAIERDERHWTLMLALRTVDLISPETPKKTCQDLDALRAMSDAARVRRLVILNFDPRNVLLTADSIGIVDFEMSSSIGDPALDIGGFIGHYVFWSVFHASREAGPAAVDEVLRSYLLIMDAHWSGICRRAIGFAGATLLHMILRSKIQPGDLKQSLLRTASLLLSVPTREKNPTSEILNRAAAGQLI